MNKYLTALGIFAVVVFLYFMFVRFFKKGSTELQSEVDDILNKDEYKVKGRFE